MPRRKSAEDMAASLFRSGPIPPRPPGDLSPPAKKAWRTLIGSRPSDFWTEGAKLALRRLCRTAVTAEKIHDRLDSVEVGSN
jgi:hypothetical protein